MRFTATFNFLESSTSNFISHTNTIILLIWWSIFKGQHYNFHDPLFLNQPCIVSFFPNQHHQNTKFWHKLFTSIICSLHSATPINRNHNSHPNLQHLQGFNRDHTFSTLSRTILHFDNSNLQSSVFNYFLCLPKWVGVAF